MSNVSEAWKGKASSGAIFIMKALYTDMRAETQLKDLWSAYKDWWTTNKKLYPWAQAMNITQFTAELTRYYGVPADGVTYKRVSTWDWETDEEDEEARGT